LAVLDRPVPAGYGRWTGPLIAAELGDVDVQYVWRFLRAQKIDLAARKSRCESNDPAFAAKAAEIVGLYLDPPDGALVLVVDEKPSIQALENGPRAISSCPMGARSAASRTITSGTAPPPCSQPSTSPAARSAPSITAAAGASSFSIS
jgi:hypothetical protein